MRSQTFSAVYLLFVASAGSLLWAADTPGPAHFVFFGYERERIQEDGFLDVPAIAGAQLKYSWRELEPEKGRYDFEDIRRDLRFLSRHGKRLFLQIQDVSFSERAIPVPDYLIEDPTYSGGVAQKFLRDDAGGRSDGWVARRWDPHVRARFTKLVAALGQEFDGLLEGVNLAETSIDFGEGGEFNPPDFTPEIYSTAVHEQMTALGRYFRVTRTIQYANFMPGEWLPWTDRGFLRAVYEHASRIGVGVGGPDLLPHRPGQKNHSYPLIANRREGVVAGLAVQDGNLSERNHETGELVSPKELERFAREQLRLDYVFWGTEEPHYSSRVLPFLRGLKKAGRSASEGRPANTGSAADAHLCLPALQ